MKIAILSPAEKDLEEGYRFYDAQSPGVGTYFLDCLNSDIDSLTYFAGIHPIVFAILDCRRDPSWIRERLMNN